MCCKYYNEFYYERERREREHAFAEGYNKGCQESARASLDLIKSEKRCDDDNLNLIDLSPDYCDYHRGCNNRGFINNGCGGYNYCCNGYGYNGYAYNNCCYNGCGYF